MYHHGTSPSKKRNFTIFKSMLVEVISFVIDKFMSRNGVSVSGVFALFKLVKNLLDLIDRNFLRETFLHLGCSEKPFFHFRGS